MAAGRTHFARPAVRRAAVVERGGLALNRADLVAAAVVIVPAIRRDFAP